MSAKRLTRLKITDSLKSRLAKHGWTTCKDVLSKHILELVRVLRINYFEAEILVKEASKLSAPKVNTCLEITHQHNSHLGYLATSLSSLDGVLHGGLPVGTITEAVMLTVHVEVLQISLIRAPSIVLDMPGKMIAGPSGCGKTQFCMMLSVLVAAAEQSGNVLYIDTESAFSASRLVEIARSRFSEKYENKDNLLDLASRVKVYWEPTCQSLLARLNNLEEMIIDDNIKLIVIDSIASLVRKEYDSRGGKLLIERTNLLAKQAAILKYLAEEFRIPVVVTNQVTTRFGDQRTPGGDLDNPERQAPEEKGYVTAALGNTWSHSVNTRLILQYMEGKKRQVLVAKSPIAPFAAFIFTIENSGLVMQEGGANAYEGTDPGLQKIRVRSAIPQEYSY